MTHSALRMTTEVNVQPRVASADVIQKFNPNNKNALIKQYKTIYHPGEARMSLFLLEFCYTQFTVTTACLIMLTAVHMCFDIIVTHRLAISGE